MPRYSEERKNAVLGKLMPPNNQPVPVVAQAEGISEATLYNWISRARESGVPVPGSRSNNAEDWNAEAKFAVVVETQSMNETEKSTYCREKGLYPEQIERWRQACIEGTSAKAGNNESLRHARNEIKRLKRKVNRKDKALAESAALLVLSKKFQALWEEEDQ